MNLVEKAIEEIRNETIEHVVNRAQIYVGKVFAQLAEHDWDIERAYPYPTSYGLNAVRDRKTYKSMLDQHQFAMYLTKTDYEKHPYSRRMDDPHYRIWDEDQEVKYIKITREAADMAFKSFIHKLTEKIGLDDVVSVELDPINKWLWNYSILHVTRKDGTKEKWKTQIIVKTSCLGKVFNQWPTRKVK